MSVGDYVRTNDGDIFQITGSDIEFASEIGSDGNLPFNAKIISSEIIDLIEVGDYVNGLKVDAIKDGQLLNLNSYDEWLVNIVSDSDEIKTIVTKEQFESMEYRIGGK